MCPHCLINREPSRKATYLPGDWLSPELVLRQKYYGCNCVGGNQVADAKLMVPPICEYCDIVCVQYIDSNRMVTSLLCPRCA